MDSNSVIPIALERVGEDTLRIRWSDGVETACSFARLRGACPCASCRESRSGVLPVIPAGGQAWAVPRRIQPVGRYAYNIAWADGHASGIYSFDLLRELAETDNGLTGRNRKADVAR